MVVWHNVPKLIHWLQVLYTYIHIHTCIHTHTYAFAPSPIYIHTHTYVYKYTYIRICSKSYIHTYNVLFFKKLQKKISGTGVLAIACAGRGARAVATDAPWVVELLRLNAGWFFPPFSIHCFTMQFNDPRTRRVCCTLFFFSFFFSYFSFPAIQ